MVGFFCDDSPGADGIVDCDSRQSSGLLCEDEALRALVYGVFTSSVWVGEILLVACSCQCKDRQTMSRRQRPN